MVSGAAVAGADTGSAAGGASSSSSASSDTGSKPDADRDRGSKKSAETGTDSTESTRAKADRDDESAAENSGKPKDKRKPSDKASVDDESSTESATDADTPQAEPSDSVDVPDVPEAEPVAHSSEATETADLTTKSSRAPPLSVVTTADLANEVRVSPWQTAWEDFVRHLQYTFFNKAPTLAPEDGVQAPNGVVTGQLNGSSNNGYQLTYTVTNGPKHGTVTVDRFTGVYSYTPDVASTRFHDSFEITADNGAAAKLPGLLGNVQAVSHRIAQALGLAQADTVSVTVSVKSWFPSQTAGDPDNSKYWAEQHYQNCLLMSVAMVNGQLHGIEPDDQTEQDIIDLAKRTPSVIDPTKMIWINEQIGAHPLDGARLLQVLGLDVGFRHSIPPGGGAGTYEGGKTAFAALRADLAAGKGVIVAVHAPTLWAAEKPYQSDGEQFFGGINHAVVVTAVDWVRGIVWVNDSGNGVAETGKGAAITIGAFMSAWQPGGYITITAALKPAAQQEVALPIAA